LWCTHRTHTHTLTLHHGPTNQCLFASLYRPPSPTPQPAAAHQALSFTLLSPAALSPSYLRLLGKSNSYFEENGQKKRRRKKSSLARKTPHTFAVTQNSSTALCQCHLPLILCFQLVPSFFWNCKSFAFRTALNGALIVFASPANRTPPVLQVRGDRYSDTETDRQTGRTTDRETEIDRQND
jgi:hypothetical protein